MEEVKWGLRKLEAKRDGEMKDLELASASAGERRKGNWKRMMKEDTRRYSHTTENHAAR